MIVVLLAVSILLPLYYADRLFRLDESSKLTWLIVAANSTVFVSLVFFVGRWDIAGYYTRLLVLGLFIAALLWSLRAHLSLPWRPPPGVRRRHGSTLLTLVLFSAALFSVFSGRCRHRGRNPWHSLSTAGVSSLPKEVASKFSIITPTIWNSVSRRILPQSTLADSAQREYCLPTSRTSLPPWPAHAQVKWLPREPTFPTSCRRKEIGKMLTPTTSFLNAAT